MIYKIMVKKTSICFYLDNKDIPNANFENIEFGNPGVGGTQYYCVAVPYYINKYLGSSFNVLVYAHSIQNFPIGLRMKEVSSFTQAVEDANENKYDILVFRPLFSNDYLDTYSKNYNLKMIAWGHNMLSNSQCNYLSKSLSIKLLLCVSREQYDELRDHSIFEKTLYLENPFDITHFPDTSIAVKDKNVTYIGSLIPQKGFHRLAKMWPKILKQVPDAHLFVIGSGALYNENSILGKWGIADEKYEMKIRNYLSDADGNVLKSVTFLGKLGVEKIDILKKTKVGVPNPTGKTENCPGSVLEFQALGIPVVSAKKFGLLDTVIHNETGYLSNSLKKQIAYIIKILKDEKSLSEKMGQNAIKFVSSKFGIHAITLKWGQILNGVNANMTFQYIPVSEFKFTNLKQVRILNSKIKFFLPFLPSLLWYEEIIKVMGKEMIKIIRKNIK